MKKSLLITLTISLYFNSLISYSQIIIDDFNDNINTNWVPGSSKYTLAETDSVLTVIATGVGAGYEGFGKTFPLLNMSKHTIISLKIKVPITSPAPVIRMDVTDNNGFDTNKSPIQFLVPADGAYHTYSFNFAGRFERLYPSFAALTEEKIRRVFFYANPGMSAYTGTFFIDDIILLNAQDPKLITSESSWKFLDNGTDPGATWKDAGFNDSGWASDTAEFGYGDGDEKTITDFGSDPSNKYATTYFRKSFNFNDTTAYQNLILNTRADDGAIVYINGTERFRYNLPAGPVTNSTYATIERTDSAEANSFIRTVLPESVLDSGVNVIAVEVHQATPGSIDLSFDLSLTATTYSTGLIRGPYLQVGTDTSIVIRWRTLEETDSRIRYGSSISSLSNIIDSTSLTTEHEIVITGLASSTKYFYLIGTSTDTLSGADLSHYFITSPPAGTMQPIKLWVTGDAGRTTNDQRAVRDSYYNYIGTNHTDAWLLLGDNAYEKGTDNEYQLAMFENMFEETMKHTVIWPTPGNHDLGDYMLPGEVAPYYDIFTVPENGEGGGQPSGTEAYYSFNYGNIHFISLDSYGTPRDSLATMAQWLKNDLIANSQRWIIAFWHHPPYSKGSHDSDDLADSGGRLVEMREQIVPLLEQYGVDLILTGHSHNYERSHMIHGHYDNASTFLDNPHLINGKLSGKRSEGQEYYKNPVHSTLADKGTVYSVLGCSGLKSSNNSVKWTSQPNNLITKSLMYISTNQYLGSMAIDINRDTLTANFLDNTGVSRDNFTIIKDETKSITLVMGSINSVSGGINKEINILKIFPTPFTEKATIEYTLEGNHEVLLEIFDETGKKIKTLVSEKQSKGTYNYEFAHKNSRHHSGVYTLRLRLDDSIYTQKIVEIK